MLLGLSSFMLANWTSAKCLSSSYVVVWVLVKVSLNDYIHFWNAHLAFVVVGVDDKVGLGVIKVIVCSGGRSVMTSSSSMMSASLLSNSTSLSLLTLWSSDIWLHPSKTGASVITTRDAVTKVVIVKSTFLVF